MHRRGLLVSDVRAAAVPELLQMRLGLLEQVSALACLEQPVRLERERRAEEAKSKKKAAKPRKTG